MPPAKPEPGRDPQMADRTRKLNVVFALTSIGLLLVFSLMVWVDYDREWKKHQVAFNALEVKLTEQQVKDALGKVGADRVKALQAELAQGDQEIAAHRAEVRKADAEIEKAHGVWYAVDQEYRFTKADIDVKRYEYEEAHHDKLRSEDARKKELDALNNRLATLKLQVDDAIAKENGAKARLAELEKTKLDAEKKRKDQLGELDRLTEKVKKIDTSRPFAKFVFAVRNLPILDLANPSLKVAQIMPTNLYDDVVFTPTPKVDRCTTCHLGIDKKGYENAPQPYRTHPNLDVFLRGPHPMEKIGCTVCHQGRGRATSFQNAAHTPVDKKQEDEWGHYSHTKEYEGLHDWDFPMMTRLHTEAQCAKCHQGVVEVPKADTLNTGVLLVEKYGCFGCHKIKGWENLRKVGPDLTKIVSKTNEDWIFRWIKEPKGFRPTRMPQIWDVRTPDQEAKMKDRNNTEANAVVAYIVEKSGRETYPDPPKGDLEAGRKTFESVGCMACHRIGDDRRGIEPVALSGGRSVTLAAASFRTHGPNLDGTGSKVNAGWLYAWVRNPKGYWHDTKMPNLRLSEKEAADITAYLMSQKNDAFMGRQRPSIDKGIRDEIVRREYLESQYPIADAKAKLDAMDDRQRTLFLGEKTIARYGCFGCHVISGFEKTSPIGVELTEEGSKLVERLDFGFMEHEIAHTLPAWVKQKLLEPRIYDKDKPSKKPEELLRMPKFHFNEDEADTIVTAVLSFTKEQIPLAAQRQLSADDRYVEQGRRLVRNFNCQGCHVVGERGGAIRAVIQSQFESQGSEPSDARVQAIPMSPPMLWNAQSKIGEGARVQTAWLHGFLNDPSNRIRPWLQVRMPTFEFSEEDVNAITRYFAAQDRVPFPYEPKPTLSAETIATGHKLFDMDHYKCVSCHVVAGKLPNQTDPAMMAPDLAKVTERLRADWLTQWLSDPARIIPGTRMPANFPANASENAFPEILGGEQKKQVEAVRAYLLTLGNGAAGTTGH